MSEELFFILVKETSESSAPRTALLAFYTDGENIVRRLNEQEAAPGGLNDSLAAGDGSQLLQRFWNAPGYNTVLTIIRHCSNAALPAFSVAFL